MSDGDEQAGPMDVSSLTTEVKPPRQLEERVVDELRRRRLLSRRSGWTWLVAAAAAAVMFAAGYGVATIRAGNAPPQTSEFALLLYEGSAFIDAPADDPRRHVRTYSSWAARVADDGALVNAGELAEEPWLLDWDATSDSVTTSSDTAPSGVLSGFFIVRAASIDEALVLAETHPHLRNRGQIELRQIVTP